MTRECLCGVELPARSDTEGWEQFEPGCRSCDRTKTNRLIQAKA